MTDLTELETAYGDLAEAEAQADKLANEIDSATKDGGAIPQVELMWETHGLMCEKISGLEDKIAKLEKAELEADRAGSVIRAVTEVMGDPDVTRSGATTRYSFANGNGVRLHISVTRNGYTARIGNATTTDQSPYSDFAAWNATEGTKEAMQARAAVLCRARWLMGIE